MAADGTTPAEGDAGVFAASGAVRLEAPTRGEELERAIPHQAVAQTSALSFWQEGSTSLFDGDAKDVKIRGYWPSERSLLPGAGTPRIVRCLNLLRHPTRFGFCPGDGQQHPEVCVACVTGHGAAARHAADAWTGGAAPVRAAPARTAAPRWRFRVWPADRGQRRFPEASQFSFPAAAGSFSCHPQEFR